MGKAILIQARPLTEKPHRNQPRIRALNLGSSRPSSPQLQNLQSPPQLPKFRRRFSTSFANQPPEISTDASAIDSNFSKGPDRMVILSPQSGRSTRILTTASPATNNAERLAMRAHRFLNLPAATQTTGKVTLHSYPRTAPRRIITEPNLFLQSKSEVPQNDVKPLIPTGCEVANSETEVAEINFAGSYDGYDQNGDNNENQDGQNGKQNCDKDDNENGGNDDDDQDGDNDNQDDENDNQNGHNDSNQDGDNDSQNGHIDASKKLSEACNEFSGLDTDDTVEIPLEFRKKLEAKAKALQKEKAEKIGSSDGSSPAASTEVSSINDEPLISNDLPGSEPPENTVGVITRSRTRGGGNGSRRPPFRRRHSDDGFSCYRHTHWKKILLITYLRGEIGNGERAAERAALERIRTSWAPLKSHTQKLSTEGSAGVKRKRQVSRRRQVTTDKKMKK